MKFPSPLFGGILIKRYRRALADVRLDRGDTITVHVFNNGTMAGCSAPGSRVLVSDSRDPTRKHPYTWELVDDGGSWVCINQKTSREVFLDAVRNGRIFPGYRLESEAQLPGSRRTDLILHGPENNCFVTFQSVSWKRGKNGCFPDCPVPSARASLERLHTVVRRSHRAVAVFHVARGDCDGLEIGSDADPEYAELLAAARAEGVEVMAFRAEVNPEGVTFGSPVPVLS